MLEIDHLTPDQDAQLEDEARYWLNNARSVEPLDRTRAADAIRAMYAALGRPTPTVLFFSSPAMCILAWRAVRAIAGVRTKRRFQQVARLELQLRSQLGEQLESQSVPKRWLQLRRQATSSIRLQVESRHASATWAHVWDQLCAHFDSRIDSRLGPSLRARLESRVRAPLWSQLRSQIWRPIEVQLDDQLGRPFRSPYETDSILRVDDYEDDLDEFDRQLLEITRHETVLKAVEMGIRMPALEGMPAHLRADIWAQVGACMGAWWCASAVFYDFCGRIGFSYALEQKRFLRLWLDQCRYGHWWFDCDGIVFVSNRPRVLKADTQGRLHNERGAALDYGDGFRLYAIQGVRVGENDVLHPEGITVERIEKQSNVELRRVLTSLYGQARYMKDSGATLVHQDERGKLWRKKRTEDADLLMVEVVNSTPEPDGSARSYMLRVPPHVRTASAAVAWTFSMRPGEYRPQVEA